ncbi:hypothetical protein ABFX02_03G102400 [Erythranthe guttata]
METIFMICVLFCSLMPFLVQCNPQAIEQRNWSRMTVFTLQISYLRNERFNLGDSDESHGGEGLLAAGQYVAFPLEKTRRRRIAGGWPICGLSARGIGHLTRTEMGQPNKVLAFCFISFHLPNEWCRLI